MRPNGKQDMSKIQLNERAKRRRNLKKRGICSATTGRRNVINNN